MPSMRLSDRREPFVFSKINKYWIWAFFGLAFLGLFVNQSQGKDFFSDSSITVRLAYPLAIVYFFWSAYDTFTWLRKRPDEFHRYAKGESKKRLSGFLYSKTNTVWFFTFYIVLMFVLGVLMSVAAFNKIRTWIG